MYIILLYIIYIICIYVHKITLSMCSADFFFWAENRTKGIFFAQATLASHLIDDGPHWLRKTPWLEPGKRWNICTVHHCPSVSMLPSTWLVCLFVDWVMFHWFLTTFAFTMPTLEKAVCPQTSGHPTGTFPSPSQQMATLQNAKNLIQQNHELITRNELTSNHPTLEAFILLKQSPYFHHQFP